MKQTSYCYSYHISSRKYIFNNKLNGANIESNSKFKIYRTLFFLLRTSKILLRLNVFTFSAIWGSKCSYFLFVFFSYLKSFYFFKRFCGYSLIDVAYAMSVILIRLIHVVIEYKFKEDGDNTVKEQDDYVGINMIISNF